NADPRLLGFDTATHEHGRTAGHLWEHAISPLLSKLKTEGEAAWDAIVAQYDQYSTREFLEVNGWSEGAIEMFGLLLNQEAVLNSSFLELFREDAGGYYTDMFEIEGGMDRLPHAFLPDLHRRIRFGAKMTAIDQTPDNVIIHYETAAGRHQVSGDYAIITVPFP